MTRNHTSSSPEPCSFTLTVLGSGSSIPFASRRPAAYFVQTPEFDLFLDIGPGSLHSLPSPVVWERLRYILITHHHVDHCLDLVALLFLLNLLEQETGAKCRPVVMARDEVVNFFQSWIKAHPFLNPQCVEWEPLSPGNVKELGGGVLLYAGVVQHISGSLAYRLECQGRSLVYSGDTGWSHELIQLAIHADCLILECSHRQPRKGHLDPVSAFNLARMAGVKLLVLSHFYPDMLQPGFSESTLSSSAIPVIIAREGLTLNLYRES